MFCPRCNIKMKEARRLAHKKRKWICPVCKKVRMEMQRKARKKKNAESFT